LLENPETSHYYDGSKRYVDATANLSAEERQKIFEGNARRVYPRLGKALKAKGR
jgi:4-oxalmesaconate hydratase